MLKILHTARYTGTPLEILREACPKGFLVKTLDEATHGNLVREAAEADYLLVSGRLPIDAAVLDAARGLRMIQRTGVGTEMLDLDEIRRRGIPVYVNAGVNARSVAEHTLLLMLASLRRLPQIDRQTRGGTWKKQQTGVTTRELFGKTVGLVGMGHIGRTVALLLHPFGVRILYSDIFRQPASVEESLGLTYCDSFEKMLPQVDVLSFHCPLTTDNERMLDARTLALMRSGAIVINTARGRLIDPQALFDALQAGKVAAAGLDTHFEEPLPAEYPLAHLDNVILTPHIGGLSYEAFASMMKEAMDNIAAFEAGRLDEIASKRLSL